MSNSDNKDVVRRYFTEAWNNRDVAVVDDLFVEDYVIHQGGQTIPVGRQALKDGILAIRSAFPDFNMRIDHVIAEDDLVAAFLTNEGTHNGELMIPDLGRSLPATGRRVLFTETALFRFTDGRIAEGWYTSDRFAMLRGLGAVS